MRERERERERERNLFAMVETFKVVVAEGSTLGRHDAMRHAVTEIHPNVIATSLLAVDSKP
jgi:hypothetical protein